MGEKKRGGKREGAGRKKCVVKQVTFGIYPDALAILDNIEHKAKFINDAIIEKATRLILD